MACSNVAKGLWKWFKQTPLWGKFATILITFSSIATILSFVIVIFPQILSKQSYEQSSKKEKTITSQDIISIISDPVGADVYLNWRRLGITPLTISKKESEGIIVVAKDGFLAAEEVIGYSQNYNFLFTLEPEMKTESNKILLIIEDDKPNRESFSILRSKLLEDGLLVIDWADTQTILKEIKRAGSLSNKAIRAWANTKYGVNTAIISHLMLNTKDLGNQKYGYEEIQNSLSGTYLTEAKIMTEIIDLRTGETEASFTKTASSYANDEATSVINATTEVARISANATKQNIKGVNE